MSNVYANASITAFCTVCIILTNAITSVFTVDHIKAMGSKGPRTLFLSMYNTTAK